MSERDYLISKAGRVMTAGKLVSVPKGTWRANPKYRHLAGDSRITHVDEKYGTMIRDGRHYNAVSGAPIGKALPSALRGQLKTGLKPLYAQPSHGQVPAHKMNARILAARNGRMAGTYGAGTAGREQWKLSGQLQRGTSRTPGSL